MSDMHGFDESKHTSRVSSHVSQIPGATGGSMHGAGVVGEGGADPTFATPGMDGYGPVKSGQKGHPGTD